MPWPALSFDHRSVSRELMSVSCSHTFRAVHRKIRATRCDKRAPPPMQACGVWGIPSLVVISRDGSVVTKNARGLVMDEPHGFPWLHHAGASGTGALAGGMPSNVIAMIAAIVALVLYWLVFAKR